MSDRVFDGVVAVILLLLLIITAYPLYFVVIASISDPSMVVSGDVVLFPHGFTLEGYKKVIEYDPLWRGYRNTLIYTAGYTLLSVVFTMMAGYTMSRRDLAGRGWITVFMMIPMFFSGGLIPTYLILNKLHLTGQPLLIIVMGTVAVRSIIVARTFIQSSIPEELHEAAVMDGCSHTKYLLQVILPLSKAIIAVTVLFAAVGQWNSWFAAMIYLKEESQMPLQMVLRDLLVRQTAAGMASDTILSDGSAVSQAALAETMKYSIIIVSTLPILCVYPFVQKYFVKGVMVGSIKG